MELDKYKVLLWDFDGVIMDSNPVRTHGFGEVLKSYPARQVEELIKYHKQNGGLPRYEKFRYFFKNIRHEQVDEEAIKHLSKQFTDIMLKKLMDPSLLINDAVSFIKANYKSFIMHIVSGSDQIELRKVCDALGLSSYFVSIVGSPILKPELVKQVLQQYSYNKNEVAFIGDSINDYDAALNNQVDFYGYNNEDIRHLSGNYIEKFM
jgi:HAD superfamily hydrolase (TIGR01549 family)